MFKSVSTIILFLFIGIFCNAQTILTDSISVVGSVNGKKIKGLTIEEFKSFQDESANKKYGKWFGLITNLNGKNPKVHIIQPDYFSKIARTTIRPKYGMHETYSRYHGYAKSSGSYIQKVQSGNGSIIPIEIYLPPDYNFNHAPSGIQWIIKNKRYKYSLSSKSFANFLIKAERLVRAKLIRSDIKGTFINFDKFKTFQRPNSKTTTGARDIQYLKASGYRTLSVRHFNALQHQGKNKTEIFNAGLYNEESKKYESYGILRYINDYSDTASSLNSYNSLKFIDLPIFSELPESILPVSGIIILEKQTELSHVNILAKNRGTLNVSINIISDSTNEIMRQLKSEIQGFSPNLINKAVKIVHDKKHLRIEKISQSQLKIQYQKQRNKHPIITLAKPKLSHGNKWLLDPGGQMLRVNEVGAKAANYGLLERTLGQKNVLKGYAIGFELYEETIKVKGPLGIPQELITNLLKEKDILTGRERAQRLTQIRKSIQAIPLESAPRKNATGLSIVDEISAFLNSSLQLDSPLRAGNLGYNNVGKLRFRSSTNCEDLPMFNGAGLYLSEGCKFIENGIRTIDSVKVWNKLKNVLSSLWLEKAFSEREYFRIDHINASLSVQINPAFSSKWLGGDYIEEWANGVAIFKRVDGIPTYNINSQIGTAAVTNPIEGELSESFEITNNGLNVKCLSMVDGNTNHIFIEENEKGLKTDSTSLELISQLKKVLETLYNKMVLFNPNP